MTKEDKELLLKDLCGRLPYGVKCIALLKQIDGSLKSIFGIFKGYNGWASIGNNLVDIETVKPYLRPMSSMTDEEKKELNNILEYQYYSDDSCMCESTDWLNAHHFDYRGLIPMNLAIEVTKENNPYTE